MSEQQKKLIAKQKKKTTTIVQVVHAEWNGITIWRTLQKIFYKTIIKKSHHTLNASLHYLVKHKWHKLAFCVR